MSPSVRLLTTALVVGVLGAGPDLSQLTRAIAAESAGDYRSAFAHYLKAYAEATREGGDGIAARMGLARVSSRLTPAPAIPDEAWARTRRAAEAFVQGDTRGYEASAIELREVVRMAPWWAEAAFNLAVVEKKLGRYPAAIGNLKVYLASEPWNAPQIHTEIAQLEYQNQRSLATVYFYRTRNRVIGRDGVAVTQLNGKDVARLANGTYFVATLAPGRHTVLWWTRSIGITYRTQPVNLDVLGGRTYYVQLTVSGTGWTHAVVDSVEGKRIIAGLKPVSVHRALPAEEPLASAVVDRERLLPMNPPPVAQEQPLNADMVATDTTMTTTTAGSPGSPPEIAAPGTIESCMRATAAAVDDYFKATGHYPVADTLSNLRDVVGELRWDTFRDAYDCPRGTRESGDVPLVYRLSSDRRSYRIVSYGSDRKADPGDPFQASAGGTTDEWRDVIYGDRQFFQWYVSTPVRPIAAVRALAEKGDAAAQYEFAQALFNGRGVPEDQAHGVRWIEKSAKSGYADSQYELGYRYWVGAGLPENLELARLWMGKAAEQGHSKARDDLPRIDD